MYSCYSLNISMSCILNAMHAIISLHMHVTLATHAKKLKDISLLGVCVCG